MEKFEGCASEWVGLMGGMRFETEATMAYKCEGHQVGILKLARLALVHTEYRKISLDDGINNT